MIFSALSDFLFKFDLTKYLNEQSNAYEKNTAAIQENTNAKLENEAVEDIADADNKTDMAESVQKTEAIKSETRAIKENTAEKIKNEAVEDAADADNVTDILGNLAKSWSTLTVSIIGSVKALGKFLFTTPAGWAIIASAAIYKVVKAYDEYNISNEEALEISKEAKTKIDELNKSYSNQKKIIDKYAESYEKLSKEVDTSTNNNISLSANDYEEFLNINNQLAEILPSLIKGYDDNGNAILSLGQNGKSVADELRELLKVEEEINNYKISQNVDDLFGGVKVEIEESVEATRKYETYGKKLEERLNNANALAKNGVSFNADGFLNLKTGDSDYYDSIVDGINNFYNNLDSKRQKELNNLYYSANILNIDENGLYQIYADASLLTEDELANLQSEIKMQALEISDSLSLEFDELATNNLENSKKSELAWKDFLPNVNATMKSLNSFQSLDSGIQAIAEKLVSGLDRNVADEIESSGSVANYLRDYIIAPLSNLSEKDEGIVSSAFVELLTLNPNDLSQSNQAQISKLISDIANILKLDENKLKIQLGFEIDKGYQKAYNKIIQDTASKFKISNTEVENIFARLSIDSIDEIANWNDILNSVDNVKDAVIEYKKLLNKPSEPATTREMINQINSLSDGFEQLDKIMASIKDEDPFDYTLLDDKALDEFKTHGGKAYD